MKKLFVLGSLCIFLNAGCKKPDLHIPSAKKYSPDVAIAWMNLHMRLTRTTPGFNSIVSSRSFAYAGLTLYESIVPGIRDSRSIVSQMSDASSLDYQLVKKDNLPYYWPASANAAMALITKSLFGNTSTANIATIDSLEMAFHTQFQAHATTKELDVSEAFGRQVADAIFQWSKSDGGHEAYAHVTSPEYVPPSGPGLWIPTPPLFGAPIHPYWGSKRSFIPGIAAATQPGPPVPYSEDTASSFYKMVDELYSISLSLSHEDSIIAKFWGDLPQNYNVPAHATNILTQLIILKKFRLDEAAIAYAKHGIAQNDALISVFKTKYIHTLIRPVSYIRGVMNHPDWNTVIPTPPHPEYTAAHGVISAAGSTVMEDLFGKSFSFTDHTYDTLYGPRQFNSFEEYAWEAGRSRILAGIHYRASVMTGLEQGRKVGEAVNRLPFNKAHNNKE